MSNLRAALTSSLDKETTSFRSRLERAEATLETPSVPTVAEVKPDAAKDFKNSEKPAPVVRDSFTMPQNDYALISQTRQRSLRCGLAVSKAEILRAGLKALTRLKDDELVDMIASLDKVKTGRPNANK